MTLTIIPTAAAMPPMWEIPAATSLPNFASAGTDSGSSRYFSTNLPPPWSRCDRSYHPLWIDHDSIFPSAIVNGEMPEDVPSPYQGMSAEWAATVSQLVCVGLAKIQDGTVALSDYLRVRGPRSRSTMIRSLPELAWFLEQHRNNPRINSGFIEPVPYEEMSYAELIGPATELSAAIKAGKASDADRNAHVRMVRTLIRRVEEDMVKLRKEKGLSPEL